MTKTDLVETQSAPTIEYYEEIIPVRGCSFSLDSIRKAYLELQKINFELGQKLVAQLVQDESMSDPDWERYKEALLYDAFRLTITIVSEDDQRIYAEGADVFTSNNLPEKIKEIYFTNVTAFSRNAAGNTPRNSIRVTLDFSKPDLIDPSPIVSEATANRSEVTIIADDISFFRAVHQVVDNKLTTKRNWFSVLHKGFSYDFGLWIVALPIALLLSTFYMESLLPVGSEHEAFRWAFFIYAMGMSLIIYRLINSYAKWAFPVNVLAENKDTAWKHRITIGGICTWIFYKIVDVLYGLAF